MWSRKLSSSQESKRDSTILCASTRTSYLLKFEGSGWRITRPPIMKSHDRRRRSGSFVVTPSSWPPVHEYFSCSNLWSSNGPVYSSYELYDHNWPQNKERFLKEMNRSKMSVLWYSRDGVGHRTKILFFLRVLQFDWTKVHFPSCHFSGHWWWSHGQHIPVLWFLKGTVSPDSAWEFSFLW